MLFTFPRKLTISQAALLPIALPVLLLALAVYAVPVLVKAVQERRRLGFWAWC